MGKAGAAEGQQALGRGYRRANSAQFALTFWVSTEVPYPRNPLNPKQSRVFGHSGLEALCSAKKLGHFAKVTTSPWRIISR